jgi:outer membrane protein OmpA-like peptidoglycan-associated protein
MKTRIMYLTAILLFFSGIAMAQDLYKGQIKVSGQHFSQKDNQLQVEMEINYEGLAIDSNESLTLTPYLQGVDQRLNLPSVLINGVQEQKAYNRSMTLDKGKSDSGSDKKSDMPVIVLRHDRMKAHNFNYKISVPFQDWMNGCSLYVESEECGCNGKTAHTFQDRVSDELKITHPHTSAITSEIDRKVLSWIDILPAPKETETDLAITGSIPLSNAHLFRGNSQRKLNHEVYYKLLEAVRDVRQMNGVTVTDIVVTGYSSPIGNLSKNERKALNRSLSLKEYLYDTGISGKSTLTVRWMAEDWDSITSLVRGSDMMLREAVLDLIHNIDVSKGREDMIRNLANGEPYRYLVARIFPQVRRVDYTIHFSRQVAGVEDNRLLLRNRPDMLTLSEFFALAATYPKGSTEYNDVFDLSARIFPDSPEANINAAAVALTRKDTDRARKYLERFSTLPQASCNMGILYLLEGNREKAEVYLELARAGGVKQAADALEYMKKK